MDPNLDIQVVFNQQDIARLKKEVLAGMAQAAPEALLHLGKKAAQTLSQMHEAAGHQRVADSWTVGPVEAAPTGWRLEVYSNLEGQTLYSPSSNPESKHYGKDRTPWKFKGEKLVEWLEWGVPRHDITPRNRTKYKLKFVGNLEEGPEGLVPATKGDDFIGSTMSKAGVSTYRIMGSEDRYLVATSHVDHPGYAGFHFLTATQLIMEHFAREEAFHAAGRVASKVN